MKTSSASSSAFLDDEAISAAYRAAPAAKVLHHAWLGGLLEHVLTLVRVCLGTVKFYPEVDPDLLVTGAILHDIGKVRELSWKSSFAYTLEGQMIGHISAQGMLREKLLGLEPFPERLRVLVEHMILSHHGKYEFGSPKLPMTPEAILLSALDDLEAKMQNMRAEFGKELANGKPGTGMTDWVRSMERPHHAWLGGLLEHVLTLVRVCLGTVKFYPEVDPDLLVTGAILHDIGKVRELSWKSSFAYTLEGQMIGHISIAQGMLREKLLGLEPFPERLRVLVEHMILSHHGKYEFGSPKLPMTPEAILLSALDDLEAKMQNMRAEFGKELANGKPGTGMTDWVRSMERPLLNSKAYLEGE